MGALNVKGNFHRAPHRGAGVMFGPSARSHRRRDPISSSSIAGPLSERVLATVSAVYPIRCACGLRKAGATIAAENETTDRQSMLDVLIGTRIRRCLRGLATCQAVKAGHGGSNPATPTTFSLNRSPAGNNMGNDSPAA
jgi:hypothetical protein